VVKLTLYLTDMEGFQGVNEACAAFFSPPYPARVTVGVKELPRGASLEVDVVAYLGEDSH
jgi:enamine deaminase RidA (YjgF/YER057c/UK114 family)